MTKPLYMAHRRRISGKAHPDAPTLKPGVQGLKISTGDISYNAKKGMLHVDVLLAYAFAAPLWDSYRKLPWAVRINAESTATGQAGSKTLKDPFVRYPDDDGENFLGLKEDPDDPSPTVRGRTVKASLKIEVEPSDTEPSLYLKATFREFVSNTLTVNVRDLTVLGA